MKRLIFAFLMICLPVQAATYYVSKTGTNGACTASDVAGNKSTITAGITCLSSGDTLMIHTGTYTEQVIVPISKSGTSWATATTISAFTGETVTVTGNFNPIVAPASGAGMRYVIFQNFIIDGSLQTGGSAVATGTDVADHIRYLNMEIKNTPGLLVSTSVNSSFIEFIGGRYHGSRDTLSSSVTVGYGFYTTSNNNLWDGIELYDTDNYGIHNNLYVPDHPTSYTRNNIVRNCVIHDIHRGAFGSPHNQSAVAVIFGGGHSDLNLVYNNVIYGTGSLGSVEQGIVFGGGLDNAAYNNTIYNCFGAGIRLRDNFASPVVTRPVLRNNSLYGNVTNGVEIIVDSSSPVSPTYSNNICTSAGTGCAITGNPLYVSTVTPDFHIQSTSPARDAGITVTAVTTDKDGFARPQGSAYDIGAYEYISAIPPPLSTISLTYPNGNENLIVGTATNVTWTSNDVHTIKLELSRDGGVTYPELIVTGVTQTADSNNSYSWTPTAPQSAFLSKIRITNLFDLVTDDSNSIFSIHGNYVK